MLIIHWGEISITREFFLGFNVIKQVNMIDAWSILPLNRPLIGEVGTFPSQPCPAKHQLPSIFIRASLDGDSCFLIN